MPRNKLALPGLIHFRFRRPLRISFGAFFFEDRDMAALTGGVAYDVVVPVGPSGIAFLGDLGKFVPLGKKRTTQLSDNGTLSVSIAFASTETAVTLQGYGPAKPTVTATTGSVGAVAYDAATKLFTVSVSGSGGTASITLH